MKRLKKWQLYSLIGIVVAVVLGAGVMVWLGGNTSSDSETSTTYQVQAVKQGSIASSTLLSGTVIADSEQYVYYDSTKGDLANVSVNVGDQVSVGQALVQYNTTEAQTAYDAAVRNQNKIARQINDLQTTGVVVPQTSASSDEGAEGGSAPSSTQDTAALQRSYDNQLQDLQAAYADATDAVNKALNTLNATTVLSTVEGTVVEVNRDVSRSTTGSNQTLVHIVNSGSLKVSGELSEYNLSKLGVGQEVTMTSKVYPGKTWTGKISYVSNYPKEAQAAANTSSNAGGGAKYPFKIEFTSDIAELKQGFTMNVEINSNTQSLLVPVTAIVSEGDKSYVWTFADGMVKKVEVTLGDADAESQAIASGLKAEDKVIANPTPDLKEDQKVDNYEEVN